MFDEQPSEPSTGKLSRARGRLLIGTNQYATISVTCYTRATGASDPQAIEKLGEEYLAAASGYALALGRTLASGGTPPTRIEVDAMCQVDWTGPEPRLSELGLQVRGEVPGQDQDTFELAAREPSLVQSAWGLPPTALPLVTASLIGKSEARPQPSTASHASRPSGNSQAPPVPQHPAPRPRVTRRVALASVLGVAALAYIFVSTQGAVDFRGLLTSRLAGSPVAAPSTQVVVSGVTTTPTRPATPTTTPRPAALIPTQPPTAAPTPVPPTSLPTAPPTATQAPTIAPTLSSTLVPPTATPVQRPVASEAFEETFANNDRRWPNNPQSTAWLGDGGYRLAARQPSQFVALRAPGSDRLSDVRVTGVFRKLGGPAGGGYGLILRDQSPARLDGVAQTGKFYVFEVGDRGEVGVWRRDGDTWVDILPWTPSPAVQSGGAPNELVAQARGSQLDFFVNGIQVASGQDAALRDGGVGVFVGGDGNDVLLNRFAVQPLS